MWQTKEEKIQLLKELVSIPSISRSEDEKKVPLFLKEKFLELDYFKENPHLINNGDLFFSALVKGNSENTIILISHYDVVGVEDYGENIKKAFDIESITDHFNDNQIFEKEEGEWLYGRGTMDMKAGLVVEMSLLEKATTTPFDGSLLLIAVGDEEVGSKGMLEATKEIERVKNDFNLSFELCLNTEPSFKEHPFDTNKYVYSGTIGKLLPSFYFKGQETHVGEPFAGLNASFMSSILTCELELSNEFQEEINGEKTQVLSNLLSRDLKPFYNVQTPTSAISYFNLFFMEEPIDKITERLLHKTKEISKIIIDNYKQKSQKANITPFPFEIKVLSFEELYNDICSNLGKDSIEKMTKEFLANNITLDERQKSLDLVEFLTTLLGENSPLIVLFYSPPFYPAVSSRDNSLVKKSINFVQNFSKINYAVDIENRAFFQGLCDLSYVSLPKGNINSLTLNMPLLNNGYNIPFDTISSFDFPVMNLGVYGCDPHQKTERLEVNYSFETLPNILEETIKFIFQKEKDL